jgi:AraC-like DNA-binding protein
MIGCGRRTVQVIVPATPASDPVAQTKTMETARLAGAVDAYERTPSAENLAEVKKALADSGQNSRGVLEIALEAGFNSKSTLNSFFKRETGLTPTEYRSQAQKPAARQTEAA